MKIIHYITGAGRKLQLTSPEGEAPRAVASALLRKSGSRPKVRISIGRCHTRSGATSFRDSAGRGECGRLIATAISEEADACEAQDHHRPGGGLGGGRY